MLMECFPIPDHEDWVQKNYYILKKFINKDNEISLIILNKGISSRNINDDKKQFIKIFSNKINFKIININQEQNKLSQIFRLLSPNINNHFKIKEHIIDDIGKFIKLHNPRKIISFDHLANCVVNNIKLKNIKKIFIIGSVPDQFVKSTIIDNIKSNPLRIFQNIIKYIFLLKEMLFIKKLAKKSDAIITFDKTVGSYFKDIVKKLFVFTNAVPDWLPRKYKSKVDKIKRNKNILFILSGNTTPNKSAAKNFIKYIYPHLKKKYSKSNRINQIRIVGAKSELTQRIKKLKFDKIKCLGWVKDISKEFCNNKLLIVTNNNLMYTRTRIAHSFSCGMPVLTHVSNIIYDKPLKKNHNIIVAKNFNEFNELIDKVFNDRINLLKISKNARDTFLKEYDINNMVKKTYNTIIDI